VENNLSVVANGNLIAYTGIPRYVSEVLKEGESWLDMMNRTKPEKNAIKEEQKANARLIAAAPDMLNGLCEAKTIIYNLCNNLEKRDGRELQAIFDEIILKATEQ
jgi:hypothetical protein